MNTFLKLATVVALTALTWMACEWAWTWRTTRQVINGLPDLVSAEAELTRQQVIEASTASIERLSARAEKNLQEIKACTESQLNLARADLVTQSTLWRGEISRQGDAANNTLAGLRSDLAPTLNESADVMRQLDEAAPLWLDCRYNPSCAYNLFQGTAKSIQAISQDVKKVSPQITQDAAATTHNLKRMTSPLSWPAKIGHAALSVAKRIWIF